MVRVRVGTQEHSLEPGQPRRFGRADAADGGGAHRRSAVSRRQFSLQLRDGEVVLTSLGLNPTRVERAGGGAPALVQRGGTATLRPGDSALLLAAAPGAGAVTLLDEPPPVQQQQQQQQQQQERPLPVVLVLVGVQGAGKSTWAGRLAQLAAEGGGDREWVRVNQDTAGRGGGRGTREQCLAAARAALRAGKNVVVDRMNLTREQRAPFVAAAREAGAPAHCVVLRPPQAVCAARAAARRHEGGLQGAAAYPAVARAAAELAAAGDPAQAAEGLASLAVCEADAEAEAVLRAWAAYGGGGEDPYSGRPECGPPAKRRRLVGAAAAEARRGGAAAPPAAGAGGPPPADAFARLMAAARAPPPPPPPPAATAAAAAAPASRHVFPAGPASLRALARLAADPAAEHPGAAWDDRAVVVADKYPKARAHGLVVARAPALLGPLDLRAADAPLVRHMAALGRRWGAARAAAAAERGAPPPEQPFLLGFHSAPSLPQLHLHVISNDFDSPWLKTRRHWNSFREPFFIPVAAALAALEGGAGRLEYDAAQREAELAANDARRCHKCGRGAGTMPELKAHLAACRVPLGLEERGGSLFV